MQRKVLTCAAGKVIFREGDQGDEMYILVRGAVELRKKVEGGEAVLKTVREPNEFFGEMSLIDEGPRSATAIAIEDTILLPVDDSVFDATVLANPKFALTIIKTLTARIRASNVQISELIETVPRERIATGMVEYAGAHGERIFDGGLKVDVDGMRTWLNTHYGIPLDDFDANLFRFIKSETLRWAATAVKTHDAVVLPESFVTEFGRKDH